MFPLALRKSVGSMSLRTLQEQEWRGALMGRTVDRARAAGQNLLTLWVRRENGRARRFYEKYGFEIDSAERSGSHPALGIEIHEVRYRMPLRQAD